MENPPRVRLLDAALGLLGEGGAGALTVRAAEARAGMPHGSVRHHFGDRHGLLTALFPRLEELERPLAGGGGLGETVGQWIGPGRDLALARYELFLMAARDPELRGPLIAARDRFVALAAARVGEDAAPAFVAALDGVVLDALVRGDADPHRLRALLVHLPGARSR